MFDVGKNAELEFLERFFKSLCKLNKFVVFQNFIKILIKTNEIDISRIFLSRVIQILSNQIDPYWAELGVLLFMHGCSTNVLGMLKENELINGLLNVHICWSFLEIKLTIMRYKFNFNKFECSNWYK